MPENELISIVTPMYNSEKYIKDTIKSVIAQTHKNWELIIVNDCSSDGSLSIAEQHARGDSRIKIVYQSRNTGISAARNMGVTRAQGRYVAFIDSDDMWKPGKLAKQLSFMQRNGYSFVYTSCELVGESGEPMNKIINPRTSVNYRQLLNSNCIVCSSVMINTEIIKVHVPYVKHEDYATWLDILKDGHTAYALQDALTEYRIRKTSVSANKFKSLSWVFNIYRKHLNMPLIQALWRVIIYLFCGIFKYSDKLEAVFKKK